MLPSRSVGPSEPKHNLGQWKALEIGTPARVFVFVLHEETEDEAGAYVMGRYLLLWLLGIPLPILILIWAFGGLH